MDQQLKQFLKIRKFYRLSLLAILIFVLSAVTIFATFATSSGPLSEPGSAIYTAFSVFFIPVIAFVLAGIGGVLTKTSQAKIPLTLEQNRKLKLYKIFSTSISLICVFLILFVGWMFFSAISFQF